MVDKKDNKDVDTNNEDLFQFTSSSSLYPAFTDQRAVELYQYNGIAFKACERYVGDVLKDNYEIKGGIQSIEEELDLKSILLLASKFAYRDGYSLLYLKFTDSGNFEDEITAKQTPVKLEVIPKSWVLKTPDDVDIKGERLNYYEIYTKQGADTIEIHKSRIVQINFRNDKNSMYMPAWRSLWMTDLTMWNVGQAYFRTAGGMYHMIKKAKGRARDLSIKKMKNDKDVPKIDSSTLLITDENTELKNVGIGGGFPDPQKSYEIPLTTAATGLKIPWQLLIGTNAGAVTGSETNIKEYFSMVQNFRKIWVRDLINLIEEMSGLQKSEITFGTLFEETDLEKAEMIQKYSDAFKEMITLGVYSRDGVNQYMNDQLGVDIPIGEIIQTQQSGSITTVKQVKDMKDIAQPKTLPNKESRLESNKVIEHENSQINKQKKILNKIILKYDFTKQIKTAYNKVNVKDSLFDRKIFMDANDNLKGLIDLIVDGFKLASIESITDYFDTTWELGLVLSFNTIKKTVKDLKVILPSERTERIRLLMQSGVGDKIVGATDDMKKDLKRVIEESILTGTNPTVAARTFAKYVDEEFANKYNNRIRTIVQTETGNIVGQANLNEMRDSGVVEYKQWITARDDRVRRSHQIHGEVVALDKPFSNGFMFGGQDINCRCDSPPYFPEDNN